MTKPASHQVLLDIIRSCSRLTKGTDAKRHPVIRPSPLHHEHGKLEEVLPNAGLIRRKASSFPSFCGSLTTRGSE